MHHFRHILILLSCLPLTTHFHCSIKVSIQTKLLKPMQSSTNINANHLYPVGRMQPYSWLHWYYHHIVITSLAQTNWKLTRTLFASSLICIWIMKPALNNVLFLFLFFWQGWGCSSPFTSHQAFPLNLHFAPSTQVERLTPKHGYGYSTLYFGTKIYNKNSIKCQVRYNTYVGTWHFQHVHAQIQAT